MYHIWEWGKERKAASNFKRKDFFYKTHLFLFINVNKFPEVNASSRINVLEYAGSVSLIPIKGASF